MCNCYRFYDRCCLFNIYCYSIYEMNETCVFDTGSVIYPLCLACIFIVLEKNERCLIDVDKNNNLSINFYVT